jgi:hypothetical protein
MVHAESTSPSSPRCTVTRTPHGWKVSVEHSGIVHDAIYTDWHRVERALARFALRKTAELTQTT